MNRSSKREWEGNRRYHANKVRLNEELDGGGSYLAFDRDQYRGYVRSQWAKRNNAARNLNRHIYGRIKGKENHENLHKIQQIENRKRDGRVFVAAMDLLPPASRADFKASPRQWLKSRFVGGPKVFGVLWAQCRRDYFDGLRAAHQFLGLDYHPARDEIYPPIFPDEVLSEAEQEQVEVYIKHHVKRGGKR